MKFSEYHEAARRTSKFPRNIGILYLALGIMGEAGEVLEKVYKLIVLSVALVIRASKVSEAVKKLYRDHNGIIDVDFQIGIMRELGDLLWYMDQMCEILGVTLDMVAAMNISKLQTRDDNGTLHGNGDGDENRKLDSLSGQLDPSDLMSTLTDMGINTNGL